MTSTLPTSPGLPEPPPTYEQRVDEARERLRAALDPQTGPEKSIVTWLGQWDLPTMATISEMAERAMKRARAQGYDLGFHDRGASR